MSNAPFQTRLSGILMDMDGVLVDSEPILREAVNQLFAEKGVTVEPADCKPFLGTGEDHLLEGVAAGFGVILELPRDLNRLYTLYLELIPGKLKVFPGVLAFLAAARSRHLKLALASSAAAMKVAGNLRAVDLLPGIFDTVVDARDVQRKKPYPDIFLTAAHRLGLPPTACLVVEDAVAGVEAAKAAGCRCLAVTNSFTSEQLRGADWVVTDLANVPPEVWR